MKIWIPRAIEELEKAKKVVQSFGFEPILIPLIEFKPLNYSIPKKDYEGIVFSSKTGVRYFFNDKNLVEKIKKAKILFSVGEETKKLLETYLKKEKIKINFAPLPKKFKGEYLAEIILENKIKSVLLPGPKERRNVLFEILNKYNIDFYKLDLYETKVRNLSREEKKEVLKCSAVSLTSPSVFKGILKNNLLEFLVKKKVIFLAIGDVTEKYIKNYVPKDLILKPQIFTFEEMIKTYKKFIDRSLNS